MDFYEVNDPYYALIKAKSRDEAYQLYVEVVSDDDGTLLENISQVSKDFTLCKYGICTVMTEGAKININTLVDDINNDKQMVLLIDWSLA